MDCINIQSDTNNFKAFQANYADCPSSHGWEHMAVYFKNYLYHFRRDDEFNICSHKLHKSLALPVSVSEGNTNGAK
jgi:hypothetical protein